jgi:hypothetical protein
MVKGQWPARLILCASDRGRQIVQGSNGNHARLERSFWQAASARKNNPNMMNGPGTAILKERSAKAATGKTRRECAVKDEHALLYLQAASDRNSS